MGEQEVTNLSQEEVLELIKDFPLVPTRNRVIITVNTETYEDEIETSTHQFAESQYVMAAGEISPFEPGQKVLLDIEKMTVQKNAQTDVLETVSQIKIDPVQVGDRMYAFVHDTVIKAIDYRE